MQWFLLGVQIIGGIFFMHRLNEIALNVIMILLKYVPTEDKALGGLR